LTRFQASKRPLCFSKAILYYGAPLPSAGSARAAFPSVISTIRALRLPVPTTGSLMIFASPLPLLPSSFAPMRWRPPQGQVPLKPRHHWLYEVARTPDLRGSCRTHPIPLPRSRIPAGLHRPHLLGPRNAVPASTTAETPAMKVISGLNHTASISAAYASSRALPHTHARLASGWWLAFTGRESNPLDSIEKFPSSTSDFLLSQVYPGAMLKNSLSVQRRLFLVLWKCNRISEENTTYGSGVRVGGRRRDHGLHPGQERK
jgi:hypothetical protein